MSAKIDYSQANAKTVPDAASCPRNPYRRGRGDS